MYTLELTPVSKRGEGRGALKRKESAVIAISQFIEYGMAAGGWMAQDFTSFSTVFQSYQINRRVIMRGYVQLQKPVYA